MKPTPFIILGTAIATCLVANAQDKPQPPAGNRPDRTPPPEIVKQFDKDGDGKLSDEERTAMRDSFKTKMEEARKAMLAKYDADGDGKLSDEEAAKARADRQAEMLKKYDKDGDGKLSEEERAAMPKGPGAGGFRPGGRRGGPGAPPPTAPTPPPAAPTPPAAPAE